jgi:glycosyltransferase involved in cell wall biosynthesis
MRADQRERATPAAIAYLVSEYPHIRHAYLLREIRGLRKLGWRIETLAMRHEVRPAGAYTAVEREERERCFYILSAGSGTILTTHLSTLTRHPLGYLRGIARAIRYGACQPRKTLRGLFYFAEAVIAGRRIERLGISHVHTHYASTVTWLMSCVFPLDVSMSIHGSAEFDDPRGFMLTEKIAAAQFVRAIGYFGRSQLMRACPSGQWDKIEICRLGVDPSAAPERPVRERGARFHLLCVGGMVPPRAFDVLIRAVAASENPAISLTLVGDGPDRSELERLAVKCGVAAQVKFAGWKTQDELQSIYAAADAFAFSSLAEGIPVVLMEAMAMSLACVAPWIAGIPELIRDGVDGFLVAPSDVDGMAEAIGRLYRDPERCRAMGESARGRVLELFNLERNIEELSEILRRRITAGGIRHPSADRE